MILEDAPAILRKELRRTRPPAAALRRASREQHHLWLWQGNPGAFSGFHVGKDLCEIHAPIEFGVCDAVVRPTTRGSQQTVRRKVECISWIKVPTNRVLKGDCFIQGLSLWNRRSGNVNCSLNTQIDFGECCGPLRP